MTTRTCPTCGQALGATPNTCTVCGAARPEFEILVPHGAVSAGTRPAGEGDAAAHSPSPSEPGSGEAAGAPVREEVEPPAPRDAAIALYPMSEVKLGILCFCSMGVYGAYWAYRNWEMRKRIRQRDATPVLRAIFNPIFNFSLFEDVAEEARRAGVRHGWEPFAMALFYFACGFAGRFSFTWTSLFAMLNPVPLMVVQHTINVTNARSAAPAREDDTYRWYNWLLIVVGGAFKLYVLAIVLGLAAE